jgi:hypothetical protein
MRKRKHLWRSVTIFGSSLSPYVMKNKNVAIKLIKTTKLCHKVNLTIIIDKSGHILASSAGCVDI